MIKKLVSLILILFLAFTSINIFVEANDTVYHNGFYWEITDDYSFSHTLNAYDFTKEYMTNKFLTGQSFTKVRVQTEQGVFLDTYNRINLENNPYLYLQSRGINWQSTSELILHTVDEGFTLSVTDELYNPVTFAETNIDYLVIETDLGTYNYNVQSLSDVHVNFTVNYIWENLYYEQDDEYIPTITNFWIEAFEIESSYVPITSDPWVSFSWYDIYLIQGNPIEDHLWDTLSSNMYWQGFGYPSTYTASITSYETTGGYPLYDYFDKYVDFFIEPFVNDFVVNDYDNKVQSYINDMQTNGILIDIPINYGIYIFDPENWLDEWSVESNVWTFIDAEVYSIQILFPDLYLDTTDIKGETVRYRLDTDQGILTYDYNMTTDLVIDVPTFGVKISTYFFTVNFITSGGTPIPKQMWVEPSYPIYNVPIDPQLLGYDFLGWTWNNDIEPLQPWDTTYNFFQDLNTFPIYFDHTFYAIYKVQTFTITLDLNGGIRKSLPNFNGDYLIVEYGLTADQNVYDLDINNLVSKVNNSFVGWFLDEALTTPYNATSIPVYEDFTIYAKWVESELGGYSPSKINIFLDNIGALNHASLFTAFVVILILLYIVIAKLKLQAITYFITLLILTLIWLVLGWLELWTIIILMLMNMILFILTIRR